MLEYFITVPVLSMVAPTFPPSHWPPLPSGELDQQVDRSGTASRKIQGPQGAYVGKDIVPMWVADMDFCSPQPVVDAIVARAQNGVYGYTDCPPALADAFLSRLRSVYNCNIEPSASWLRWIPGLLPGLNHAVSAACRKPTDAVVIPTPIYAPFLDAPFNRGARLVTVNLCEERRGEHEAELYYSLDLAALEVAVSDPEVKLLHFCNPHNPVGRCWTRNELEAVARLCVRHDVVLCSDEVWGEVPLDAADHPFLSMLALLTPPTSAEEEVPPEVAPLDAASSVVAGLHERLIVLTSPSKCFNVAPLDIAVAVIPSDSLRRRFRNAGKDSAEVGCFAYVAASAAYIDAECEAWRQRLVAYLRANREYAFTALTSVRGVRCVRPEASYLMWIDATDALPPGTNAEQFFRKNARVGLTGGVAFGGALGTVRLNLGCTQETLVKAIERMVHALETVEGAGATAETGAAL